MTIEQIEICNYLNQPYYLNNKINALIAVKEQNKSLACKCTANYENDGASNGSNTNSQEDALHKIADIELMINNEINNLIEKRNEISRIISKLDNPDLEAILNYRYLAYKNMDTIANELCYDKRTVQRKHKQAVEKIHQIIT